MSAKTSTTTTTDSIAIGTPKAVSVLALLWEEEETEEGFEEMTVSDGGVEIDRVDIAEELTVTDGSAEPDGSFVSISTCKGQMSKTLEGDTSTTYCLWQKTQKTTPPVIRMLLLMALARERLSKIRCLKKWPT